MRQKHLTNINNVSSDVKNTRDTQNQVEPVIDSKLVSTIILSALLSFYGKKGSARFSCYVETVDIRTNKATIRVEASM